MRWKPYNVVCTNSHDRECCITIVYGQGPIKLDAYVINCPLFYLTSYIVYIQTDFPFYILSVHFSTFEDLNEHSRILFIVKYRNKKNRVKIHMLILCMRKQNGRYAPFKYGLTNRIWPSDDDMIVCVSVWKYVSKIKRGGASIVFFCIYSCKYRVCIYRVCMLCRQSYM